MTKLRKGGFLNDRLLKDISDKEVIISKGLMGEGWVRLATVLGKSH